MTRNFSHNYVCDKRYLLTLMFLDSCVEPMLHDSGIDFYRDGQNYALASLLYYTAPTFWGKKNFDDVLYLFQRAQRTKTKVAIQALVQKAKSLQGKELSENLIPLAIEHESCLAEIVHPRTNTDAAFVVMLSLLTHIEKQAVERYEVVHDTSKNLNQYNRLLSQFIGVRSRESFRQTEITTLNFPLKLSGVSQTDSRDSCGIQLADLLIGGIIEHTMSMAGLVEKNDYNQEIVGLYEDNNLLSLLPSLDFQADKDFRKGTQAGEMIDFIARKFS